MAPEAISQLEVAGRGPNAEESSAVGSFGFFDLEIVYFGGKNGVQDVPTLSVPPPLQASSKYYNIISDWLLHKEQFFLLQACMYKCEALYLSLIHI